MHELSIRRLGTGTIYRLLFFGLLFGCIPIFTILGVLGSFGLATMNWNGQPLTGIRSAVAGPFMGVFFALIGTAFCGTATALGLWIRAKFTTFSIQYYATSNSDA
jgi:hypothetical protein